MVLLGLFAFVLAQETALPVFKFQNMSGLGLGNDQWVEGQLDFGVAIGDTLQVPVTQEKPKKKSKWLDRLKGKKASSQQQQAQIAILNHGLKLVILERKPGLHPWMRIFDKLEAGVNDQGRVLFFRATIYAKDNGALFIMDRRFNTTFKNADYPEIMAASRDGVVQEMHRWSESFPGSGYLAKSGIQRVFLDPANRAILLGNPFNLGENGGVYIEILDGSPILEEIKAWEASKADQAMNKAKIEREQARQLQASQAAMMAKAEKKKQACQTITVGMTLERVKQIMGNPYSSFYDQQEKGISVTWETGMVILDDNDKVAKVKCY